MLQLICDEDFAIYEFIAWTGEADVVQDGERWDIGYSAWTEEELVAGHISWTSVWKRGGKVRSVTYYYRDGIRVEDEH